MAWTFCILLIMCLQQFPWFNHAYGVPAENALIINKFCKILVLICCDWLIICDITVFPLVV